MSKNAIEIKDLHKGYRKGETVLNGFDMTVPEGSVYGLIGRNGAGKSTTLNTLMGLLKPWSGSVNILGEASWGVSVSTKRRIAYAPEVSFHFSWLKWLNVRESLAYIAQFYPDWKQAKADEMLDALDISPDRMVKDLSLGQTRSVSIIAAICCNPDLLILDEPSGNLDVIVRRLFQSYIIDFIRQENKTVLISSHILTDLEKVIDYIGIIRNGRMIVEDELDSLKEKTHKLRLIYDTEPPRDFDIPNIISQECFAGEAQIVLSDLDKEALPSYPCVVGARKVEIQPMSLEDIFVAYSMGSGDTTGGHR
jgi:ABC-2 type transport system ATP-binding protein